MPLVLVTQWALPSISIPPVHTTTPQDAITRGEPVTDRIFWEYYETIGLKSNEFPVITSKTAQANRATRFCPKGCSLPHAHGSGSANTFRVNKLFKSSEIDKLRDRFPRDIFLQAHKLILLTFDLCQTDKFGNIGMLCIFASNSVMVGFNLPEGGRKCLFSSLLGLNIHVFSREIHLFGNNGLGVRPGFGNIFRHR